MIIEIYKKGENNPIIINTWVEFFNYFSEIPENAGEVLDFWDPICERFLHTRSIIENLRQIQNTQKILEYLSTKEF